ncbi:MAG TPA: polysaccharide deacetylase family protein [Candidatus Saccharimonadales bacterium]|jgi:peptidoglycan/xylan/chitin deacetylase (PgdA/CDA1 family)|nr:polysaccharide deacetylase family protein [Candidatus Saccharimonadales bacterium]
MIERIDKRILAAGASLAISIGIGNLLVPAADAASPEDVAAANHAAKQAAIVKVGGHAVEHTAEATASSVGHGHRANGGTPNDGKIPIGCTAPAGSLITSGSPDGRRVALTFDDGPSVKYTPKILATLKHYGVHATFFEEGKHVHGRESLMTDILASGDEIGNHSYHHPEYPGYGELSSTNKRIKKATGFKPCLFRPPYGLVDGNVSSAASRLGLEMVEWDVDSLDDKHPGVSAIKSNVLSQAQPGSIILMHDGGHHPQTVKALPGIIKGLRARGFGFDTVTELTGGHFIYAGENTK